MRLLVRAGRRQAQQIVFIYFSLAYTAHAQQPVECYDLFGFPLFRPALEGAANESATRNLAIAQWDFAHDELGGAGGARVASARSWVWLGRRLAYAGRYADAVDVFVAGRADLAAAPGADRNDTRLWELQLLRHEGHRELTLRRLDDAAATLDAAGAAARALGMPADVYEPDGAPNGQNVPTSTLASNAYYHQALAHHLRGEWAAARAAHDDAMRVASANPDQLVASAAWAWVSAVLNGDSPDAATRRYLATVPLDGSLAPALYENGVYYDLCLCHAGAPGYSPTALLARYANASAISFATVGYGVAMQQLLVGDGGGAAENDGGDAAAAAATLDLVLRVDGGAARSSGAWAAFGYIAAEALCHRNVSLGCAPPAPSARA